MSRNTHDRTRDHSGTEDPDVIVLTEDLLPFHAGDDLRTILASLVTTLSGAGLIRFLVLDAILSTTASYSLTLDADVEYGFSMDGVVFATMPFVLLLQSIIAPLRFSVDAVILGSGGSSFTLDAAIA